jgi:hypothetical protein
MTIEFPATMLRQRDVTIYNFTVSADDLPGISRVEGFGQVAEGVNRQYDENHALRIADAMLRPETVMLESICGDLRGDWVFRNGLLVPNKGAYLSIDDGQHRRAACEALNAEERARWSFPVVATMGWDWISRHD